MKRTSQSPRRPAGAMPGLRRLLVALVCALTLVAGACGSSSSSVDVTDNASASQESSETADSADDDSSETDSGGDAAADESSDDGADESGSDDEDGAESDDEDEAAEFADDGEGSPLAQLMGWPTGPDDYDEDQQIEEQRAIERSIQECMVAQGFEYTPRDVSNDMFFGGGWPGEGLSEEEFAREFGFGISTTFDQMFEGPSQEELAAIEGNPDPNFERMEAMSDGERAAYNLALDGKQPEFDEETGMPIDPDTGEPINPEDPFAWEPGGCRGEAYDTAYGKYEIFEELDFEGLYERIEADPRIVELSTQWSACMAESGYLYEDQREMYDDFFKDFDALQQDIFSASFSLNDAELDIELDENGEPIGDLPPAFFGPPPLSEEQEATLAEIQKAEVELAVASFECDPGEKEVYAEVQREYELRFIEENRSALEAVAAGS